MSRFNQKNDLPLMQTEEGIVLFHPHVPKNAERYVSDTLKSRWIGHGPKVEEFERNFHEKFCVTGDSIAVGSGTDALHLAYLLAGICAGDEVIAPLFTCTATNLPFLYIGAQIKFLDVDPNTLNISVVDLEKKVSRKTKAICLVHYGGLPCDMDEIREIANFYKIPVIEDAAHALGAKYSGKYIGEFSEFTMYSFQAIKHLTTGDGGLLNFKDQKLSKLARRLRWFGIDREDKQKGVWENDIKELGYKYQMTDIAASLGLAGLEEIDEVIRYRKSLFEKYVKNLVGIRDLSIVNDRDSRKVHGAWLFTILVERRQDLQKKLRSFGVESAQTHYRNDRYSIFGESGVFPGMDEVDDKYLVLPLHTKMQLKDVDYICGVIKDGW